MTLLADIFADAFLALLDGGGREVDDPGYQRQRLPFNFSEDGADLAQSVRFGPWRKQADIRAWVIYDAAGQVLDCGPLIRPRTCFPGDEIVYGPGSIKAAALGDLLGATFVFMPSAAVVVAPPAGGGGGNMVGLEMAEVRPWWLPKRRWEYAPEDPWRQRVKALPQPQTRAVEYQRSSVAEALLGIRAVEL